jgi:hypothetical protein
VDDGATPRPDSPEDYAAARLRSAESSSTINMARCSCSA